MFELTIKFETREEILQYLNTNGAFNLTATEVKAREEEAPVKKSAKKAVKKVKETAPSEPQETAPKKNTEKTTETVVEETTEEIPYDNVKNAVNNLAVAKGREAVIDVFNEFGIKNAKELTADQYEAFIVAAGTAQEAA